MDQTLPLTSELITKQIVEEVADLEGADALDLPPLYQAVDPDALEAIFAATHDGNARVGRVKFPYAGYTISVKFEQEPIVEIK